MKKHTEQGTGKGRCSARDRWASDGGATDSNTEQRQLPEIGLQGRVLGCRVTGRMEGVWLVPGKAQIPGSWTASPVSCAWNEEGRSEESGRSTKVFRRPVFMRGDGGKLLQVLKQPRD